MASRTTLPVQLPLPAERFFRISLFLLLLTSVLTLIGTGKIDLFTSILGTVAILYRARRWWYGHEVELTSRTATLLVLCYLVFFPVDMFFLSRSLAANSPNPPLYAALISSVHFLIFVMLVRLYSARTDRDAHFLVMLSFAAMLAAAVLTVDSTFLFLFFLFLLFAVSTYAGLELRRGAAGALVPVSAEMPQAEKKLARALGLAALSVSVGAILCGTILFFLLPRVSAGYMGKTSFNPTLLSGFSDQVELGQIGEIKKSSAVVLRVETGSLVNYPALRWRGNALANFDGKRWTSADHDAEQLMANPDGWIPLQGRPKKDEMRGEILQFTVLQEPMASDALFVAGNVYAIRGNFTGEAGGVSHRRSYLFRDTSGSLLNPFHNYVSIRYTGISQLPVLDRARLAAAGTDYPADIANVYLQLPEIDKRIPEFARTITAKAKNPYEQAAVMEAYLKTKFRYTLDLTGNAGSDPIAQFLFKTRAGHCEYFASSMTLMLRTLGIPSREVNGFLPGEFNDLGGDYIVRASDAHSWVEAYFPENGWIVFDPTPDAPATSAGFFTRLSNLADWAELTWNDWVISYDFAHQTALAQSFQIKSRNWREEFSRWSRRTQFQLKRKLSHWQLRHGGFSLVLPALLLLALVGLRYGWIGRLIGELKTALALRGRNAGAASSQLASRMYSDMLRQLGKHGYLRSETQTPFEFAATVKKPGLGKLVEEFTTHYAAARFGGNLCDVPRLQRLLGTIRAELRTR